MKSVLKLIDRIANRVNISLADLEFEARPIIYNMTKPNKFLKFYAFYGVTDHHPLYFHFSNSSLAGSYFFGKCRVDNSVLYKSDIRGDELKEKGDRFHFHGIDFMIEHDESIHIKDSYLNKTLVHSSSHDPEYPELFLIKNTAASPYSNIHGSPCRGVYMGHFSTADFTVIHDCILDRFAYVQSGTLSHKHIEPGRIWVKSGDDFDFSYNFPTEVIDKYISFEPGHKPEGIFMDFITEKRKAFQRIFDVIHIKPHENVPSGTAISRYSVIRGKCHFEDNVLVAQRAYLENAWLGKGANAQENCFIVKSRLEGYNVTAHGAKIIYTQLGKNVFVGFNSFLRGKFDTFVEGKLACPLVIGESSIVMPHTIIDLEEPVTIPPKHLVWGYITNKRDLKKHSIPLEKLADISDGISLGAMKFSGSGKLFVDTFKNRITKILEQNGAHFKDKKLKGHAQKGRNISYNIIQPYSKGPRKGLYPTMDISV
ncbi:MAG: transferase [Desulfobacterales bacterium]|nr:transferase [Desulfobacterales bacterium]